MTLEELAEKIRREGEQQQDPEPPEQAKGINLTISEGCRRQILQDIKAKQNPYKMLLTAAEAISRLDNDGDTFYLQVRDKLIEVYGRDVSEDNTGII